MPLQVPRQPHLPLCCYMVVDRGSLHVSCVKAVDKAVVADLN